VPAAADDELVIVARVRERGRHLLVGVEPVAVDDVEVGVAVLQGDAQRLARRPADARRPFVAAADVDERADVRGHLGELVGPMPQVVENDSDLSNMLRCVRRLGGHGSAWENSA